MALEQWRVSVARSQAEHARPLEQQPAVKGICVALWVPDEVPRDSIHSTGPTLYDLVPCHYSHFHLASAKVDGVMSMRCPW